MSVNVLTKAQVRRLSADPCVDDVESEGMDDDRFFVHLKEGYDWGQDPHQSTRTKSFGSYREARHWLKFRVAPAAP